MFIPSDQKDGTELPRGCTFSENDWHILASFWHPVLFSSEVRDKPVGARLMDVNIVVYRTESGLTAARDLCIHRGAALSLGWMDEARENVVCPMHGLHYDHQGRCTKIPSLCDSAHKIPEKMRLTTYQVCERYGLVWVCLKPEAIRPLPEWPLLEEASSEWLTIQMPKGKWNASASRHCENFNDFAHLSWVHVETFGNRSRPEIPNYKVEKTEAGLRFRTPYTEVERMFFDAGSEEKERKVQYSHEFTYPFATDLMLEHHTEDGEYHASHIYDVGSPISATQTAIFQLIQTNIPGATAEDYIAYQGKVNEEDAPIVESQHPEELPLNLVAELHIPADRFSLQYRRDLVNLFGLGRSAMTA